MIKYNSLDNRSFPKEKFQLMIENCCEALLLRQYINYPTMTLGGRVYVNENITHGNIQPKLLPEQQSSSNTLCFLPKESWEWVGGTYGHNSFWAGGGSKRIPYIFL